MPAKIINAFGCRIGCMCFPLSKPLSFSRGFRLDGDFLSAFFPLLRCCVGRIFARLFFHLAQPCFRWSSSWCQFRCRRSSLGWHTNRFCHPCLGSSSAYICVVVARVFLITCTLVSHTHRERERESENENSFALLWHQVSLDGYFFYLQYSTCHFLYLFSVDSADGARAFILYALSQNDEERMRWRENMQKNRVWAMERKMERKKKRETQSGGLWQKEREWEKKVARNGCLCIDIACKCQNAEQCEFF